MGYRYSFERQAVGLGMRGWVRNQRDGAVGAEVDGDVEAIEAIIQWAHHGPPASRVDKLAIEDAGASSDGGFQILPTL